MSKRKKTRRRVNIPKKTTMYLQEALKYLRQGNLKVAQRLANDVLRLSHSEAEFEQAQTLLAEVHFRFAASTADPQKMLDSLDTALSISPDDARFHFYRGIALLRLGRAATALKAFDLVAEQEPDREGLAFFRQLACLLGKKTSRKERTLSKAEANTLSLLEQFSKRPSKKLAEQAVREPVIGDVPQVWAALLKMRHAKTWSPASAFDIDLSFSSAPIKALLTYYQGVAALRADDQELASKHWHSALDLGFGPKWAQKNIGILRYDDLASLAEEKRWKDLIKRARRLPSNLNDPTINKMISLAFFHLGSEQADKNKWKQAVKYWEEAAQKANNRYLAQNLALAREQAGQWPQAAQAWRDMLRFRPRKEDHQDFLPDKQIAAVWEHIADCYQHVNDDAKSIECLRKAIQAVPKDLDLRFKLVAIMSQNQAPYSNPDAVIREVEAILHIDPKNIEALTQKGHLYKGHWRYDPFPVWKDILRLDPHNSEAQQELIDIYINQVMPRERIGGIFGTRQRTYKQKVALLNEGLELLPDNPKLTVVLGFVHLQGKKKTLARDTLLRAYTLGPHDPYVASMVIQNLIYLKEDALIEKMIPEVHTIPGLLPAFWIDQAQAAMDHPAWPRRFFDAALDQVNYTNLAHETLARVLIEICMCLMKYDDKELLTWYLKRVEEDVPKSGALEYLQGYLAYSEEQNTSKARRLLRKAKKMANAANDIGMLQEIQMIEQVLSMSQSRLMDMVYNMGGFDDDIFF